jgi:hypothetical protein
MTMNPDQMAFSETIRGALEPVFADFQQSMMAFTSRYNEKVDQIYVCGGTSLLPGLPEYLAARWNQKVRPLEITRLYPHFTIQPQKSVEWLLPQAAALGLSQVSGEQRSQINFRSGKLYSASRSLNLNFQQFVYPAKLALSIYLVAILSVIGQTVLLGRQLSSTGAQLDRGIQNVIGRVSTSYLNSLKSSPTRLKSTIDRKVAEFQAQVKGTGAPSGSSALDTLQTLSQAVSKATTMEIKKMEYKPSALSLTVEAPSQAAAEKAVSTLAALPFFQNPKAGPLENAKGARKKFSLNTGLKGR